MSRSGRRRLAIGCIAVAVLCLTAGTAFAVTGFNLFGWHTDTTIVKNPREWQRLYHDATRELTLPPGEHWPDRTLPPNTVTSRTQAGRHRRRDLPDGMGVLLGGRHPPRGRDGGATGPCRAR